MEVVAARLPWRTVVSDYLEMTKPKVQSLLLFTTIATMYVAGDPSLGLWLSPAWAGRSPRAAPAPSTTRSTATSTES
jgi:heme O synthase-like polyprenyltransferase